MTTRVEVVLCVLPGKDGGLAKVQESGTRSLYFHFEWVSSRSTSDASSILTAKTTFDLEMDRLRGRSRCGPLRPRLSSPVWLSLSDTQRESWDMAS